MKVVVTGGRGFLGTHVCTALREAGHEPLPLGRADGFDTDRLRSLGWRPEIALEDGIRSALDWMLEAA